MKNKTLLGLLLLSTSLQAADTHQDERLEVQTNFTGTHNSHTNASNNNHFDQGYIPMDAHTFEQEYIERSNTNCLAENVVYPTITDRYIKKPLGTSVGLIAVAALSSYLCCKYVIPSMKIPLSNMEYYSFTASVAWLSVHFSYRFAQNTLKNRFIESFERFRRAQNNPTVKLALDPQFIPGNKSTITSVTPVFIPEWNCTQTFYTTTKIDSNKALKNTLRTEKEVMDPINGVRNNIRECLKSINAVQAVHKESDNTLAAISRPYNPTEDRLRIDLEQKKEKLMQTLRNLK